MINDNFATCNIINDSKKKIIIIRWLKTIFDDD